MIASAIHAAGVQIVAHAIHADQVADLADLIADHAAQAAIHAAQVAIHAAQVAIHAAQAADLIVVHAAQATDQVALHAVLATELLVDADARQNAMYAAQHNAVSLVARFIHLAAHQLSANHAHLNAQDLSARLDAPQVNADKV